MSHPEMHTRTRRGGGRLRPIHFKEESISLCHPERSEGSLAGQRSFAALRMTMPDALFFEMYWGQAPPLLWFGFALR